MVQTADKSTLFNVHISPEWSRAFGLGNRLSHIYDMTATIMKYSDNHGENPTLMNYESGNRTSLCLVVRTPPAPATEAYRAIINK